MVNASLEYEGNTIEIIDFEYNKKRADKGDPNNIAFIARVECAAGFMGTSRYLCDMEELRRFMSELDRLFKKQVVSVKLTDHSLGSYISFKLGRRDIFTVSGMFLDADGDDILKFEFVIDRSVISTFMKELRDLISEYYGI